MRRSAVGDIVYHVLNRANARMRLFEADADYLAFMKVLAEAHDRVAMRTLAYCVMPNHWHLVLWPRVDGDLSRFMHWVTMTHAKRWHSFRKTSGTGHVYQHRYSSFAVESDRHYLTVCRYVERNALRAGLVARAEDWRWGSLWARRHGGPAEKAILSPGPLEYPEDWAELVNEPQSEQEEERLRKSLSRGCPFGTASWTTAICKLLGLQHTLRSRGRPPKQ